MDAIVNDDGGDDDRTIEQMLDAVDERTKIQKKLNDALTNGFMWIARERYRDALATYRLEHVVSDSRKMCSQVRVRVDDREDVTFTKLDASKRGQEEEEEEVVGKHVISEGLRKRRQDTFQSQSEHEHEHDPDPTEQVVDEPQGVSEEKVVKDGHIGPPVMAMPSKEVREAMSCFSETVELAIKLASTNNALKCTRV